MTSILDFWPFSYPPRQSQITALEWLEKQTAKYVILELPVGCHQAGTPIMLYDGTLKMVEDIIVGDILMGPDSRPRKVKELHRGVDRMFQIHPNRGEPFVVNGGHILSLKTTYSRERRFDGERIINISVNDYLRASSNMKKHLKLYKPDVINFCSDPQLPIAPYFLGLLLGDGTIVNGHVGITTCDPEIRAAIYEEACSRELQVNIQSSSHSQASTYYINTGQRGGEASTRPNNSLLSDLRELGVYDKRSGDKFIPHQYKTASIQDRLNLLAGLIDTDGYYKNVINYCTKSMQLANDVKFVARSLGFSANAFIRTVNGIEYHDITISGDLDRIPTRITRKQAATRLQKKRVTVTGFEVQYIGFGEYFGFAVDDDQLYLMGDFTVTHNSGKSNVGITYSLFKGQRLPKHRGDSFILTPQKILQKQYEDSFFKNDKINLASLYGKSNYSCHNKRTSCDIGSIIKPECQHCPHKAAKIAAKQSANTVMNYKLALLSFGYTSTFKDSRELMILDECHTLEEHLVNFDAVIIAEHRCIKYGIKWEVKKTIETATDWLRKQYVPKIDQAVLDLEHECEPLLDKSDLSREEIKKLREFSALCDHRDEVQELLTRDNAYLNQHYVLVNEKGSMSFKRLYGSYTFHRILANRAKQFLFMSSTVLDKDGFCRDLGIDPKDAVILSLPSEFPVENRPVIYMPQMKMNVSWKDEERKSERKVMGDTIRQICKMHKDDSGIIHAGSFQIAQWLVEELEYAVPHRIYHHNPGSGDAREGVIQAFMGDPQPSILISPSITEGLDLKDDLARFAIFAKVPFGNLGDAWIKRRMELSSEWYQRQALIDIIQGGGRVVRTPTDKGNVYILDASWGYLYKNTFGKIPRWWRDAYSVLE